LQQNTATALLLTTTDGDGRFQPQAAYLNSLMQTMPSGGQMRAVSRRYALAGSTSDPGAGELGVYITTLTIMACAKVNTIAQAPVADFNAEDAQLEKLEACNTINEYQKLDAPAETLKGSSKEFYIVGLYLSFAHFLKLSTGASIALHQVPCATLERHLFVWQDCCL
jgi:hypothetical protein